MAFEPDECRTLEQNKKFHAMVGDIAKQVKWAGEWLDEEDWKRLLLAAMYGQKVVPNPITGIGFVTMNNRRSRALTVAQMSDFIAEIEVFGIDNGVNWTDDEQGDSHGNAETGK